MHDAFPFIDSLIIPTDAGPNDPRIEINLVDGEIAIYGTNGDLVALITPEGPNLAPGFFVFNTTSSDIYVALEVVAGFPGITFNSDDTDQFSQGRWNLEVDGAGGTRNFVYNIRTPRFAGALSSAALIEMRSASQDASEDALVNIEPDLQVNNHSVPRGLIVQNEYIANDGPHSVDATTDMGENNVSVEVGRRYEIELDGLAELSAALGAWQLNLNVNGTYVGTFCRLNNVTAATTRHSIHGSVFWTAPATASTDDFTVIADERTGTADLTLIGANPPTATDPPRLFTIKDVGLPA